MVLLGGSCAPATRPGGQVTHVVVCWLKQPGDHTARRQLIQESRSFEAIPGVVSVWAGSVLPSTRPAVDSSFDVAVVMRFADERALNAYEHDPRHLAAVQRTLKPLVARYIVYDFSE